MKIFITIVFTFFLVSGLFAQTEKGTILFNAGSNFGFSSLSVTDYSGHSEMDLVGMTITETAFSLNAGAFVIDNLALGLLVNYSSSKTVANGEDDLLSRTVLCGFMARYYIGNSGLWGEGSYILGSLDEGNFYMYTNGIGASLGYAWYLSDNISINPSVGYLNTRNEEEKIEMKMAGLSGSVGIAIHL